MSKLNWDVVLGDMKGVLAAFEKKTDTEMNKDVLSTNYKRVDRKSKKNGLVVRLLHRVNERDKRIRVLERAVQRKNATLKDVENQMETEAQRKVKAEEDRCTFEAAWKAKQSERMLLEEDNRITKERETAVVQAMTARRNMIHEAGLLEMQSKDFSHLTLMKDEERNHQLELSRAKHAADKARRAGYFR